MQRMYFGVASPPFFKCQMFFAPPLPKSSKVFTSTVALGRLRRRRRRPPMQKRRALRRAAGNVGNVGKLSCRFYPCSLNLTSFAPMRTVQKPNRMERDHYTSLRILKHCVFQLVVCRRRSPSAGRGVPGLRDTERATRFTCCSHTISFWGLESGRVVQGGAWWCSRVVLSHGALARGPSWRKLRIREKLLSCDGI